MQNLVELTGFEYGLPPLNNSWYGLWCPLLDCFLLVGHDLKLLKKIQTLTVTKILTVVIELDSELYRQRIIDNSCASSWTIKDPTTVSFTPALFDLKIYPSTPIIPSTLRDPAEVNRVQIWLIFLLKWIRWIEDKQSTTANLIKNILDDHDNQQQLYRKIYQILLLEHNPTQAEILINQAIHEQNNCC